MTRSDGSIIIDTRVDTDGFGRGVKSMKSQIGGLTSAVWKLGTAIGVAFGVKALIDFGKSAIELGSDLQEVQNVVDVTFSTMNEAVNEFAKNAAETAGLSETMAKRYTGTFGTMAKAFGFAESEAFDMSTSLTQLAGDVASFYNLTQDEAYTKLKSVFTGETESLKDLGVVMTQNALDSYAMAKGYGKTTSKMSEQEKVALRYSFVLDQLSAAQGDFVRTSDSWANQTRILSLNFDSFKANIGQALINIFTPFLKILNMIVSKMAQLSQRFVEFSELLVGKSTSGGGGSPGETVEELADGFDDVTDSITDAEKAQKKYLSGLDEIRTFTEDLDISSGIEAVEPIVSAEPEDVSNLEKSYSVIDDILTKLITLIKNEDWNGLGKYLSDGIVGALDFLSEKLDDFDWKGLGEDVGEFLSGVDWIEIIKSALKLKINIWKAISEVWFGSFNAAPLETSILTAIGLLKFTGLGSILSEKIANAFGGIANGLVWKIGGIFLAAWGGYEIGNKIAELIWPDAEEYTKLTLSEQIDLIFESLSDGSWKGALWMMGEDIREFYFEIMEDIFDFFGELASKAWDIFYESFIYPLFSFFMDLPFAMRDLELPDLSFPSPLVKLPGLATGAVIPPNAPFAAVLGDQKHGTNIEAPLDTIKQAFREVVGNGFGGGQYAFSAQINRRVLFEEFIEEAKLQMSMTGCNPLDLK